MARQKKNARRKSVKAKSTKAPRRVCCITEEPPREFDPNVHSNRAALILRSGNKWANGTLLHYYFFDSPAKWKGNNSHKDMVRRAFKRWKGLEIGLEFKEVNSADEAEIRVGFERNDGHWSYVGRRVLQEGSSERTMNLDKSDQWDIDTALHEIGHTLGFPHEHQNPNAGIQWDEEKVYAALARPPNNWDRATTFHNIIRKLDPDDVQGSSWDPNSIMHYEFEAGLITKPVKYKRIPLIPAGGLSTRDQKWVKSFYPLLNEAQNRKLEPFRSIRFRLEPGKQENFSVIPDATRRYSFRTFGLSDTVMALFERVNGENRFRAGDDDSGYGRNASFDQKLFAGREYTLRIRLYWSFSTGDTAVMMW